jgi:hypothetical protein
MMGGRSSGERVRRKAGGYVKDKISDGAASRRPAP